jgi:voltage-gated potassium channel
MQMANLITRPAASDFLKSKKDRHYLDELLNQINIQINELPIANDSVLVNKTIGQLEVQGKGSFIIVALRRSDKIVIKNPDRRLVL